MEKRLAVDTKGRININSLLAGQQISSVKATIDKNNRIILEPFIEIPARELWLHQNPEALAKIKKGLSEVAENKVTLVKEDFSKYINE